MSICKNCNKEFLPCKNFWTEELGRYGMYACSKECAKKYVDAIIASRQKNKIPVESIVNEVQEKAILEEHAESVPLKRKNSKSQNIEILE